MNRVLVMAGLIGAIVLAIAVIFVWPILYTINTTGAQAYLEKRGYVIEKITWSPNILFGCSANKSRRKYVFEGTREGRAVKGYLCYGGLTPAVIH